ncbi:MAG: T9SS type A sorting domain-containing protein [Bacteroidales bacterium]|nr:T9SS type A sorting domain-containing protein [Bacteroidales bacterium]
MRRLYLLSVLCLLICGTSMAQVAQQNFVHKKVAGYNSFKTITTVAAPHQRDNDILWSCNFEEGSPAYTLTKSDDSDTDWQIITEADYPNEMYTSSGRCYFLPMNFTGHPGNSDPNQQISETPEHWAFLDASSDLYHAEPTIDASLTFSEIDLSSCAKPKLQFIQSWRSLNQSSETIYVMVSTDNGANWTEHLVNDETIEAKTYVNGIKEILIPEAGNQGEVSIRFRYVCTNESWHYGWQIDDIKIVETPRNDLAIVNGRMSMFGYLDYRDTNYLAEIWTDASVSSAASQQGMTNDEFRRDRAYQFYDPYAQSPRQNWVTNSSYGAFNIEVANWGVDAAVPKVNVKVVSPSGEEIYNKTATGHSIATSEGDTLDIATIDEANMANSTVLFFNVASEEDIELGRYTITYTVFADGITDDYDVNNTLTQYFDITDNNYSKSYFEPTFSACINCNVNSTSGEDEYGTEFLYLYSPDDIMSVDIYINRLTKAGTAVLASLYERSADGSSIDFKRQSEPYEIAAEDKETWINLTFENEYPFEFQEGESYRLVYVMIKGMWDNSGDDIYLGASDVLTTRSHNSYIRHGSDVDDNGEPNWYYGGQDIAITFHTGEGVNGETDPGSNVAQNLSDGINMYPNPSTGIVNFSNVENATIEIYNMMGQVVASMSNASENASIDLSGVANGNYVVRIVKDGAIATSKLNIVK